MELRALRYFVATAEELHFGRAADRLGIAQPALSIAIRKLEGELEISLFDRSTRKVELTDAGKELLRHARSILASVRAAEEAARRAACAQRQTLRVGFSASTALGLLPEIVRSHHRRWPEIKIEIIEFVAAEAEAELEARRFELAILRGPVNAPGSQVETLIRERLLMAMPADHPLAASPRVDLARAADEPFVMFPRHTSPALFDTIVAHCVEAGFSPKIVQEAVTWAAVSSLVAAGIGITIAPASARYLHPPRLVFKPLDRDRGRAELVAAWSGVLTPAGDDFLATSRDVLRRSSGRARD
jgi:DNA-binding transcriptional LysR family regulator